MNVLMDSYASEDDGSDDGRHSDYQSTWSKGYQNRKNVASSKQDDVNYEEVQMDLSEDSEDSRSEGLPALPKDRAGAHKEDAYKSTRDQTESRYRDDLRHKKDERARTDDRVKPEERTRTDDRTRAEDRNREERSDRDRSRVEERSRSDDWSRSSDRSRGDRFKEDDRHASKTDKDDNRDRRDRDRNREDRERHSRDDDRDRYRDRRDKDSRDRRSRRSSSRERKRGSRSPKYERSSRRSRSRSRSRERYSRGYNRRGERPLKANMYERQDPQRPIEEPKPVDATNKDNRFFIPGITGRFKEQIEKRKLLWQKKDPAQDVVSVVAKPAAQGISTAGAGSRTTKVWEATTFAQDNDGKVASKFKRLMGIRNPEATDTNKPAVDVLKRQEEMFSSMEQQYEVARTATHTMRGVGLGFGSFQR